MNMDKIGNKINAFSKYVIIILFTAMCFVLAITGLFGSCYVNTDEYTYYVSDDAILHVFVLLAVIGILLLFRKFLLNTLSQSKKKICWYILIGVYAILALWFVLYTQMEPRADQKSVVETALHMLSGNYTDFQSGGYMDVYPNQVGIVYVFYWLFKIFPFGYNTIRVFNVIALVMSVLSLNGIANELFPAEKNEKDYVVGVVTILFLPIFGYVTFLYGNTIGMGFSLSGIYCVCRYFRTREKSMIALGTVALALSVLVKENFLINLIGVLIFLVLDLFRKPNKKTVIFLVVLLLGSISITNIAKFHTSKITGEEISTGVPTLAWVAMGLQGGYMASGWHNQYNENVYRDNQCDTELANQEVKENIKQRVQEFVHHPGKAVSFFYKKTISQWNNPTFQCIWINDLQLRKVGGSAAKGMPKWLENILGEPGNSVLTQYMNCFQTLVLFGVCMWILLGRKEIQLQQLILSTIFIGGFIFHFIWEAKCQYVLPYFMLLIPYSVQGFRLLMQQIDLIFASGEKSKIQRLLSNRTCVGVLVGCLFVIVVSLAGQRWIDKVVGLTNVEYQEYVNQQKDR